LLGKYACCRQQQHEKISNIIHRKNLVFSWSQYKKYQEKNKYKHQRLELFLLALSKDLLEYAKPRKDEPKAK
jgi:hypothetical protein